jgi:hypothetical protein
MLAALNTKYAKINIAPKMRIGISGVGQCDDAGMRLTILASVGVWRSDFLGELSLHTPRSTKDCKKGAARAGDIE